MSEVFTVSVDFSDITEVYLNGSENNITGHSWPPLEAVDSWKQYLLSTLYLMTSIVSFVGNLISIIVLIVGKRSSPELKKYLICLSVSDILMALFSIPFTYTDFMLGRWVFPHILCPFAQFITIFSLCVSVATLTAIGIERYLAIIHPLRPNMALKYRSAIVLIGIWMLAIGLASPQLWATKTIPFTYDSHTYYKCREVASRVYSTTYSLIIFTITFMFPLITLSFVYGSIGFKMFRKQIPGLNFHPNNNSLVNKLKAVKISSVIVILFIVFWLPIQLYNLIIWYNPFLIIRALNYNMDAYIALFFVCHWISSAHSFVNPIIYGFMSDNFRKDLHNIVIQALARICRRHDKHNTYINRNVSLMTTTDETNV